MGYTTEHRGRRPTVFVPCTGQHVLEPTRATRVLYIVLSSQKEFVDNVEIKEPLGSSDHNQMHFNVNIKSDKKKLNNAGGILGKATIRKLGKN